MSPYVQTLNKRWQSIRDRETFWLKRAEFIRTCSLAFPIYFQCENGHSLSSAVFKALSSLMSYS